MRQTKLDILLIMAYSVGREHQRTQVMNEEEGRAAILLIKKMFAGQDLNEEYKRNAKTA